MVCTYGVLGRAAGLQCRPSYTHGTCRVLEWGEGLYESLRFGGFPLWETTLNRLTNDG
jgi:hypothetical protein